MSKRNAVSTPKFPSPSMAAYLYKVEKKHINRRHPYYYLAKEGEFFLLHACVNPFATFKGMREKNKSAGQ